MPRSHNERCRQCKQRIAALLAVEFTRVESNWDLDLPCKVEDYKNSNIAAALGTIHAKLQRHRGHLEFVRASRLPRVDFYVPDQGLIIEFDESQHFTKPRELSLTLYPAELHVGFSVARWKNLCKELDKKDNDPVFRDEQRAWYDTIRDFAPQHLGVGRTIRLYARDLAWCEMDAKNGADVERFAKLLLRDGGSHDE